MPRNQRVSIRGKGSDIFFEHLQPQSTEPESKPESIDASKLASIQAVEQASNHTDEQASMQASDDARKQVGVPADAKPSRYPELGAAGTQQGPASDPAQEASIADDPEAASPSSRPADPWQQASTQASKEDSELASKHASSQTSERSNMQAGASVSEQASANASMLASDRADLHADQRASKHASLLGLEHPASGPENVPDSLESPGVRPANAAAQLGAVTDQDQADMQASMPASEQLSMQASLQPSKPGTDHLDVLHSLWKDLSEAATITNAFRFTETDMQLLTDATYSLGKVFGIKVSKQEVVRLALRALLLEYERERQDSLLARYAHRKQQLRRGDI